MARVPCIAGDDGARRPLWLVPLVYTLLVTAEFLALTQLALELTARGASALAVGLVASSFWGGILAVSLCADRLVMRLGHSRSFIGALAATALASGSLTLHAHYAGWLAAIGVMGVAGGVTWVSGEAWLAETAPPARRGLFVGLFETCVGIGMVCGPALLSVLHRASWPPLPVAAGLAAAAALGSAAGLRGHGPGGPPEPAGASEDDRPPPPIRWRRAVGPLVGTAVLAGVLETGSGALLPSILLRLHADAGTAAALGAVVGLGSALMPTPCGLLSDRLGLPRMMMFAWRLLLATTALLALAALFAGRLAAPLLWPAGLVLGGMGATVYTLVIVEFGRRYDGAALLRATTLLVTGYTSGTTLGPAIGGLLFDAGGLTGLALGLLASAIAGWTCARRAVRGDTVAPPTSGLCEQAHRS